MKAPAIKDRPKCPACSNPLRPAMLTVYRTPEMRSQWQSKNEKEWTGRYLGYGAFCTLSCCQAYANAMFKRHGETFVLAKTKAARSLI